MILSTLGIVLHSFKYGETGLISRILTREVGLQTFLVQGVRKSKSRFHANLFQPLSIVDMVVYQKDKSNLQRIKEMQSADTFNTITTDIRKSSLAIFMSEILLNAFRHQETQPEVFDFIHNSILQLDESETTLSVFHFHFLLQLSRYLGFHPGKNFSEQNCYFNLQEGLFQQQFHSGCIDKEQSAWLHRLSMQEDFPIKNMGISQVTKSRLLKSLIEFYKLHLEGFGSIKSLEVLEVIFEQ
jgi:DNA repair protein RecO (recombination protein O)